MTIGTDKTLAANWFTANVPNFAWREKTLHLLDSSAGWAWRRLKQIGTAKSTSSFPGVRPPGDVSNPSPSIAPHSLSPPANPSALSQATTPTLRSRETWRDLPQLPETQVPEVGRYANCVGLAQGLTTNDRSKNPMLANLPHSQDAFFATTRQGQPVLPNVVRNSTLINQRVESYETSLRAQGRVLPRRGEALPSVMTQLADPKTGFSAGITFDTNRREIVIAFAGLGSANMSGRQGVRCASNWLGGIPKNMSQASKLTRLVKEHVAELNKQLPDGQKIKLTLTGHSMGGGLASYAALRNKVPAVVMNPMRLGWGARARVGKRRLEEADKYLTEIVVQGDWVSDNHAAKLTSPGRLIGFNSRGPLGNARRFLIPNHGMSSQARHNDFPMAMQAMVQQRQKLTACLPQLLPFLQRTSPRAHGNLASGDVRKAVSEALQMGLAQAHIASTPKQRDEISKLVQRLVDNDAKSDLETYKTKMELKYALTEITGPQSILGSMPTIVDAIQRDLVSDADTYMQRHAKLNTLDPKAAKFFGGK